MNYQTQIEAAKKEILTPQMKEILEEENIRKEELIAAVAEGRIVIPANRNHFALKAKGVGAGLRTKINVNLGVSKDSCNFNRELEKVKTAIDLKADGIMDLSIYGDIRTFRQRLTRESSVMTGTVPVYELASRFHEDLTRITAQDFIRTLDIHGEDGIDFCTVHAGLTRETLKRMDASPRLTRIVSRGGSVLYQWMKLTGEENPFYHYFDEVCAICRRYDITLSLGDGLRPGSIADSTDASQIQELIHLGELVKTARDENVQVMVEGPGHVPVHEIAMNIQLQKKLCHNAPFYVLGPLVTDVAPGYDHITSAIGGTVAAAAGADFLCYVTPAEHLRLPDLEDMKEGIIASRIAAHAGDLAKGIPGAQDWDRKMSEARYRLDWKTQYRLAIDPEKARRYRESAPPENGETCSMCGELCSMKRCRETETEMTVSR